MAELRPIRRSNPLSNFQQAAPTGGSAFRVLGDMANQAYDFLKPIAIEDMQQRASEDWREVARRDMGSNRVPVPEAPRRQGDLSSVGRDTRTSGVSSRNPNNSTAVSSGIVTPEVTTTSIGTQNSAIAQSLSGTESGGNFQAQNNVMGAGGKPGHFGRLQFGQARMEDAMNAGVMPRGTTPEQFMADPALQEKVEEWHFNDMRRQADRLGLTQYIGQTINGVPITMDGILAMGHLGGMGGAKRFLESNGAYDPSDAFGTSLSDYARTHGNATQQFSPNSITDIVSSEASDIADETRAVLSDTAAPTARISTSNVDPSIGAQDDEAPPESADRPNVLERVAQAFVRTSDGNLEPRLFSPASGEILQAYNATAKQTYLTEAMLAGREDLMNLSNTHISNPDDFKEAASEYIDDIVGQADPMLQRDLRTNLETETSQRYLGMLDDQQRETRQRASNSNQALVSRTSTDYAEALASGDLETAERARVALEDLLYARQSIPGLSWTPEQSENVIIDAMRSAERLTEQRRAVQSRQNQDALKLIIESRQNGLTAADEDILDDPSVWEDHPELAAEAQAQILFQEYLPTFNQMPRADQNAVIEDLRENPIEAGYQIDIVKAAEGAAAANAKAWDEDAISAAQSFLPDNPPPPVNFGDALTDPAAFAESLAARREYGLGLRDQGFVDTPSFFTKEESEVLQLMMGQDVLPEARVAIAQSIVEGLGTGSQTAINSIDMDPVLKYGAQMMAAGGNPALAIMALEGQELIKTGQVQLPAGSDRMVDFAPDAAQAMSGLRNAGGAQEQIAEFARSLYAANAQGLDPKSPEAEAAMRDAVNMALGQSVNAQGKTVGGVQEVGGSPTLLPMGLNGEDVEAEIFQRPTNFIAEAFMVGQDPRPEFDIDRWSNASNSGEAPMWGSEPMSASILRSENARLVSLGGNSYRIEVQVGSNVSDIQNPDGSVFVFDLQKYMDGG